jgi:hypothetical protein
VWALEDKDGKVYKNGLRVYQREDE